LIHQKSNSFLECLDIILRFEECHRAGLFNRIFGRCNSLKRELNECLSVEVIKILLLLFQNECGLLILMRKFSYINKKFQDKRLKNAGKAKEVRKNYEKVWKELDELEDRNKK
jgi:hypothetical protein